MEHLHLRQGHEFLSFEIKHRKVDSQISGEIEIQAFSIDFT